MRLLPCSKPPKAQASLAQKKLFIPKKYLAHFVLNEPVTPDAQTNSPILINLERGTAQAYVPLPPQEN